MNNLKNRKGITLVSLVVTIIILLILAAITLTIANGLIFDKVMIASTKTIEAMLKEKIEIAYMGAEASYWEKYSENSSINKLECIEQELKQELENIDDFEEVTVSTNSEKEVDIAFSYKNKKYNFQIGLSGEIKQLNLLKGNVKIGDYLEYPIEYTDAYSKKHYTSSTGWRVIDDGVTKGTSGHVRIVSTGIPGKWFYDLKDEYADNEAAVNSLINDFENITIRDNSTDSIKIKGSYFKDEKIATRITTLTLSDINQIHNALYKTNRELHDTSGLADKYHLLQLKRDETHYYYWLATPKVDSKTQIYYMCNEGIESDEDVKAGIRPVIYLKDSLEGKLENNVWKIIND